ncbi:protein of unknown function [Lactiplantibacillus plantarum]
MHIILLIKKLKVSYSHNWYNTLYKEKVNKKLRVSYLKRGIT